MQLLNKFTLGLSLLALSACTNLSEFETLPTVQMSNVVSDLSDRTHPVVALSYCVNNPLDVSVDITDVKFTLEINGLEIDEKSVVLNETIEEFSKSCHDLSFTPDVINSPKAASTLLESIFSKSYRIEAELYFDDEEVLPNVSHISGQLN